MAAEHDRPELVLIVPAGLSSGHPLRGIAGPDRVTAVEAVLPMMSLASHVRMWPLLGRLRGDVYHYPHFNLPLLASRPSVVTVHDVTPFVFARYFAREAAAKRAYFWAATALSTALAAAVIVPSRASGEAVASCFPWARRRLHVIPEGVDARFCSEPSPSEITAFRERHALPHRYLLYVGVSRPHKNLAALLRAYASVAERIEQVLVLAGQPIGPMHELRELAVRLGIDGRVRWLGYVPDTELPLLYRCADAFVLCSLFEGFGLPVAEAMASGTAVLCSDRSALREIAGGAAMEVDPSSVPSIAHGIERISTDLELRSVLTARGRDRARCLTWRSAAKRTLAVYAGVLGSRA